MSGGTINFTGPIERPTGEQPRYLVSRSAPAGKQTAPACFNMSAGNIKPGRRWHPRLRLGFRSARTVLMAPSTCPVAISKANNGDFLIGADTGSVGVFNMTGGQHRSPDRQTGSTSAANGADGTFNISGSATVNSENMVDRYLRGRRPARRNRHVQRQQRRANVNIHSDTHIGQERRFHRYSETSPVGNLPSRF